jgi:hypothetical protein
MGRCVRYEHKEKVDGKISKLNMKSQKVFGATASIPDIKKWNPYFSTMGAKNNKKVHRNFREFFDRPLNYDQ